MGLDALVVVVVGIALVAKVIWELHLSPLARQRIPGPKRAAVSNAWQYWLQFRHRKSFGYHAMFERYGPVVRLGPNRVAFRNIDAVKSIYSTHLFRKSSAYSVSTFGGAQNMVSTSDPTYHARSRRLSIPAFRGENLRTAGHALLHEMEVLVDRLNRDCVGGGYVNVIQLFPQLTLDVLGLAVLGVRFDQIATRQVPEFEKHLQSWFIDKSLIATLPRVVASIFRKLPIPRLQEIVTADDLLTKYVKELYENVDEKSPEGRWSMLETYKAYRDSETGQPAPIDLVVSDLCMMFLAGMETTAISLAYITYQLAVRKDMWEIMRAEVGPVDLQAEDFLDELRRLPYLNAFIREILRVHGPAPIFLERVVPAGGATLDGYFLPEGTEVGAQAYSSHLDERFFPRPHVVDPLRWVRLDDTTGQYVHREDITPAMNSNYFPFSFGIRSCVGKPLADLELALTTAILIKNFCFHLHKTTTSESMRAHELGVLRPQSHQCLIRFEHVPFSTA